MSWASLAALNRFTSNWYRASSSGVSSIAPYNPNPALLTRVSVPPAPRYDDEGKAAGNQEQGANYGRVHTVPFRLGA